MRHFIFFAAILGTTVLLAACNGNPLSRLDPSKQPAPASSVDQLIDTTKLKKDANDLMNSIASGHLDTNKLKAAGSDYLSTAAKVLSDSGIDKMGGNGADPSQKAASDALKKMRDAAGLTPGALDSLKKAADLLKSN